MPKRQLIGVVKSDKTNKTRRVEIERLVQHPQYGKFMRRRTVCHVHDEKNESHEGDTVEITSYAAPSFVTKNSITAASSSITRTFFFAIGCASP